MHPLVGDFKQHVQRTVESLKEELKAVRTGRATPALVENLPVTTYGGSTTLKLKEVSSITTEGPSLIVIVPFDISIQQDIEKAILQSTVGLTPAAQGTRIIIKIPPLSEEQRQKYVRLVGQLVEDKKVHVRGNRDDARRKVKTLLDQKTITEDDKFRIEKLVDEATQKANEEIQQIREAKEKEIMEV